MHNSISWTLVVAGLAVVMMYSPRIAAQGIDDLLERAEQALGGPAVLADVQSVRIRSHGTWEMPSRIPATPYEVEVVFRRPDHVRLTWQFPEELGGTFSFGHDGQDAWGIFGAPPARCKGWHREMVLHMATELQLLLLAPARAAFGDTFALDSAETADSPALVKVTCRPYAAGKPWNVWFAKETGDLVKLEHDSYHIDGQPILGRMQRSVPNRFAGLNYPTRAKFEALRDGKVIETVEETVDAMELNPELPADYFACPAWEVDATTLATKDVAAETVVTFEHRGPYAGIGPALGRAMDAILAVGLVPVGAASGTYLNDPNAVAPQDVRTVIAVRVANLTEAEPVLPGEYEFTTQPAMRVAYAYHRGDYSDEGKAHGRLRAWMVAKGLQPTGPPRTIWYHDPEVTVTDDLISEVQIPIQ